MKKTLSTLAACLALAACQNMPHGAQSAALSAAERNKANAVAFYNLAFNEKKAQEAADRYIGSVYLQHNPYVADGKEAFVKAANGFFAKSPQRSAIIKRAVAEGDLVVLHVHSRAHPQDAGRAVVDIFRFDDKGKIVEHWDVAQDVVPETASGRSMF